jgi:aspartate kinase
VGDITTLGRGGSDLTAVALAAALQADLCEFYKDVDGVYTANPKVVPLARKQARVAYEEMLEFASLGAQVLNSRSVLFAKKNNVTIHVRSVFHDGPGTLISEETEGMEELMVSGVTSNKDEAKLSVLGLKDQPGIAARLFKALANAGLNVDMIIQNVSEGGVNNISFTVPKADLARAQQVLEQVSVELEVSGILADEAIAKVSAVGVGMKSHSGVAAEMFECLAEKGINIMMISTSEIKISCVVAEDKADEAVRALHTRFGLDQA